jgi:hypothetical protein
MLGLLVLGKSGSGQSYNNLLVEVAKQKSSYASNGFQTEVVATASDYLYGILKDSIFPAWYGTVWDFNGITNQPKVNEIACGYFVSTTLKHVGFRLNRYKLAQQAAAVIIQKLVGANNLHWYNNFETLEAEIKQNGNHIYVLGLDYHVGFLVVENYEVYFVHSDFYEGKVLKELALSSPSILGSERFALGQITHNNNLIKKWIQGEVVY